MYGENYDKAMEDVKQHPSNQLRKKHIKNRGTLRGRNKFSVKRSREEEQEESESSSSEEEEEEKSESLS